MYVHLGADTMVSSEKIIAILDLEAMRDAESSREFLRGIINDDCVVNIGEEMDTSSVVLTDEGLYLSPISSKTLRKRTKYVYTLPGPEEQTEE